MTEQPRRPAATTRRRGVRIGLGRPVPAAEVPRESLFLLAGARAILLQIANPAVGAGVADHSDFRLRALARLHGTLTYLYAVEYGTPEDARAVRRIVDRAHGPVRGPGYSAFDPALQRWVAATLAESMLSLTEAAFGPLSPADGDELVRVTGVIGSSLQMPAADWPSDRSAFDAHFAAERLRLRVSPEARGVAEDLLDLGTAGWWLRPFGPYLRLITAGLLPPELRRPFGLQWDERRRRRFDLAFGATVGVYRLLPRRVRTWPSRLYLRRLRARVTPAGSPTTP